MIDYRWFFLILAVMGALGMIAGFAAMCSVKCEYKPKIRKPYGNMEWANPKELQL